MIGSKFVRNFSSKVSFGKPVYIVAAKRTPIGSFIGKLAKIKAPELGSIAIREALASINVPGSAVDEVILGNVCSAGIGQAPARQAALGAGIPVNVPATTINKVCSSGLKSITYGAMGIGMGHTGVAVTGGFESMSNVPFYVMNHRKGNGFGNEPLIDGLAHDGLTDPYNNCAMGLAAEKTASDLKIDRAVQDELCILSYERTIASIKNGRFAHEIVPVKISDKETFTEDEEHKKYVKEKIPLLKPVFSKTGTITAGNASKLNDAGCAVVLMSEEKVKEFGLKPLARIISYADAETEPIDFCIAPSKAIPLAAERAGMKVSQIEYFEINEAFAVTVLSNMKLLDLDVDRINVNGGAMSLGHPIGFSGARVVQNLISVLKQNKAKYGAASLCNGGGGSTAIIIENL